MGNHFEFNVVAAHELWANEQIDKAIAEIQRIEKLLTTYSTTSQTYFINEKAGVEPVKVDKEVLDLIARAQRISALTQGAFDITYGSFDKRFWNFDTKMTELPKPELAKKSIELIDYQNIVLDFDKETIFLKKAGMRIGFGGIGKGYAAEMAKSVLINAGVESGIVNASGDLCAWGNQPNGKPWTVGIATPNQRNKALAQLNISNKAIATSGDYEKFAIINGKRYSHTIAPKTGFPVSGVKSVTIITTNAEFADAMTTPIMVMGIKVGLGLINQMNGIACVIIDDNDKIFTSKNIKIT